MVKHTQIIRLLLLTNYLSVSDHFVGLGLKGLSKIKSNYHIPNLRNIMIHDLDLPINVACVKTKTLFCIMYLQCFTVPFQ